ncbi:uncharacterized protein EI97DRAFT_460233 [Westerdykella ornata]|uniref:Uncharacterized protein n=1 Tax=Westerdykella ornata TaxID=318751 RepID=A0A6A6JDM8_WESOR|nr:uncharacterized protein EI97DRAFT_460233 [Westerdykella ornata]KAF2274375.1 hypothetical protein EI97DRAFT_460233 [Westerdykella ornata]
MPHPLTTPKPGTKPPATPGQWSPTQPRTFSVSAPRRAVLTSPLGRLEMFWRGSGDGGVLAAVWAKKEVEGKPTGDGGGRKEREGASYGDKVEEDVRSGRFDP